MKRNLIIGNLLLAVSFSVCCVLSLLGYSGRENEYYYNNARVVLASDIAAINSSDYENAAHTFYIADLGGNVTYTTDGGTPLASRLNLQELLQTDHMFSAKNEGKIKLVFPIEKDGSVCGFAVFTVPEELVKGENEAIGLAHIFLPLIIWGAAALLTVLSASVIIKKKMLMPISEISDSAEEIIKGNLDKSVVQKTTSEILGSEMGRLTHSFELMRDELKTRLQREKQLQTAHKELLCCMSHDLRTPISTIKAHAEAIRDGLAPTEEKREKYISTIIAKTDVVSHMISDLLDHSNAECNQMSIVKSEFYITEYFSTVSKELEIYCRRYNTYLTSEISCPKILVSADRGRINQVIYNLVENAVKYNTNSEKKIWLRCSASLSEQKIYFSVEDNGNGVSMSDISFVFDKFYRAEKSRSMEIPGAGLGLSICKYIVEAHGGEITLESQKGKGAVFTFSLNF